MLFPDNIENIETVREFYPSGFSENDITFALEGSIDSNLRLDLLCRARYEGNPQIYSLSARVDNNYLELDNVSVILERDSDFKEDLGYSVKYSLMKKGLYQNGAEKETQLEFKFD